MKKIQSSAQSCDYFEFVNSDERTNWKVVQFKLQEVESDESIHYSNQNGENDAKHRAANKRRLLLLKNKRQESPSQQLINDRIEKLAQRM